MSKLTGEVGAPVQRQPEQIGLEEYLEKLSAKGLNLDGHFMPDPTPIAPPVGFKRQPSMVEIVRDMVRGENLRLAAEQAGADTFEEGEDFDVGDEPDLLHSPFENDFDPPLPELLKAGKEAVAAREAATPPDPANPAPEAPAAPARAPKKPPRDRGVGSGEAGSDEPQS